MKQGFVPATGLHPADVERLVAQLDGLVVAGNTVIVVEHDMRVVAAQVAKVAASKTATYLARFLANTVHRRRAA